MWGVYVEDGQIFVIDGDVTVCEISDHDNFVNPAPNGMKNAHLLAAAPDLLEAIEGLLEYDRVVRPVFRNRPVGAPDSMARIDQDTLIQLEDNARAAIAKAKGESK